MSDRQRRIQSDWNAVEERARDLEALGGVLGLTREDLAAQMEPLELAVEGGCVEYKRGISLAAFRELDGARFKSLSSSAIQALAKRFSVLVYVTVAQRMLCDGTLIVRERQSETEVVTEEKPQREIKEIIAEVQERIAKEPEIKARQPVKNILLQLTRYTRELENLKEATARTPADKRPPIAANFRTVSEEIYASIRRNYEQLEADEKAEQPKPPQHILLRFDMKPVIPLCRKQARLASEIRSSLNYIREEQIGIRELLEESAGRSAQFGALLDQERSLYEEIGGTETIGLKIALGFRSEIQKRIGREIAYY